MELFTNPTWRNLLHALLMSVEPPVFALIARMNRYCAKMAHDLQEQKQAQWLELDTTGGGRRWRFRHSKKYHGTQYFCHASALSAIVTYHNNIRQGEGIESNYNFTRAMMAIYVNGLLNGPYAIFTLAKPGRCLEFDRLVEMGTFVNEFRHGLITHWDADGTRHETEYRNGERHGRELVWNEDGSLKREANYVHDKRV